MVAKTVNLPNIRKLFLPDPGMVICDVDLDRADAQVVGWEADDPTLKTLFREGLDVHLSNASSIFDLGITMDQLRDSNYAAQLASQYKFERDMAKRGVHAANYGASAHTIAKHLGITIKQAEAFLDTWFTEHPGVYKWHERIQQSLEQHRAVWNRFGFRRFYFDRIQSLLPEALGWIPQSTVAQVINRAWANLDQNIPEVEVLLQVHDSLVFQVPEDRFTDLLPVIRENCLITIPYDDPLIIGVGIKASTVSWGDCVEYDWEGNIAA